MMRIPTRVCFWVVTLYFVASLFLSVIRPWYWAHLSIPICGRNYFTIDNRANCWSVRVGYVGGVDGLEFALTHTNPEEEELRAGLFPFPATWIIDWCFRIRQTSPFFLLSTPLLFPVIVLGVWPVWELEMQVRRWRHPPAAVDGSASLSQIEPAQ